MKFKDLVIGEIYQYANGICRFFYRFTAMINDNTAKFEGMVFDNDGKLFVVDECIYKTENDIANLEEVKND